ncbi:MAG TPA: hypothetical protein VLV89_07315 [Candidatus Acidoferrum sp.]|nr:hypothetical protein [Candidatus Acidoferrum sp.]
MSAAQTSQGQSLGEQAVDQRIPPEKRKATMIQLLKSKNSQERDEVFAIASNREIYVEIRVQAVNAIGEEGTVEDSYGVSNLLQPYNPMVLRLAVGSTIEKIGCSMGCVANVLHYLERIWKGEHALEDWVMIPGDPIKTDQVSKQNLEVSLLYVLIHNKKDTRFVLTSVYGLGTEFPSPTAILAVEKLRLTEACPDLRRANRVAPPPDEAIRKDLERVLNGVCRSK